MATTTHLALFKPATTDLVNLESHINANWDDLDSTIATQVSGPSCALKRVTNQTINHNDDTMITWTSAVRNDSVGGNAMWDVGNPGRIVIRRAGLYVTSWKGVYADNSTGHRAGYVTVNGDDAGALSNISALYNTDFNTTFGTAIFAVGPAVDLAVGDVVRAVTYQNSGGNLDLVATGAVNLRFSVIWVPQYVGV